MKSIEEKTRVKKVRARYGDKVFYHFHKRGYIQYTCIKLEKDCRNWKLLKDMKKSIMECGDKKKLQGTTKQKKQKKRFHLRR